MNESAELRKKHPNQELFTGTITALSTIALLLVSILTPPLPHHIPLLILLGIFIALQYFLWLYLLGIRYNLIHLTILGAAVFLGVSSGIWAGLLGLVVGSVLRRLLPDFPFLQKAQSQQFWREALTDGVKITLPLVLAMAFFGWSDGLSILERDFDNPWFLLLSSGLSFGLVHGLLTFSEAFIRNQIDRRYLRGDMLALVLFELLPLLLLILIVFTYPALGNGALIVLAAIVTLLSMTFHYLGAARVVLERQVEELTALDKISQALTAQIDLHRLLASIKDQVTQLLGVDNFYVALVDRRNGEIWYPFAVKRGELQDWPRRPLTERLTDRVITTREPILVPARGHEHILKNNLPLGEDPPYAWLGVPLIAGDEVIGCLASFSVDPQITFDQDDLNLFSILAGQTGVAIEIALHNALLSSDVVIGRDRLTAVLNSISEGIVLVELDGRVTLVNSAMQEILGIPGSDLLGKHLAELPESVLNRFGLSAAEAMRLFNQFDPQNPETSSAQNTQIKIVHADKVFERAFLPLQSAIQGSTGWIILMRDVTEEYRLQEARDLLSETLVHDLRSPVSSVISALNFIQESLASGETDEIIQPSLEIAQRSANRLLKMVESLLEIARLESGRLELHTIEADIGSLIEQMTAEFVDQASQDEIRLVFDISPDLPKVHIDRDKIQRVLNNLIDNALKFTGRGGKICIRAEPHGEMEVVLRVTDNGPGIPSEYREKIFERFVQVPGLSSRRKGAGLGLTFCRLAIEAHGGKIWVESQVGEGSTFVVVLPIKS